MPKIEYPVAHGKTVYECMTHMKFFGCRAFLRREKLYTVNVVEVIEIAPGMKQPMVVEDALVCSDCYHEMGYKTKWVKESKDTTPDMFKEDK